MTLTRTRVVAIPRLKLCASEQIWNFLALHILRVGASWRTHQQWQEHGPRVEQKWASHYVRGDALLGKNNAARFAGDKNN